MSSVTAAMMESRAAKDSIRQLWVDLFKEEASDANEEVPLYLTLSGAEGLDISALAAAGAIQLTETGAIAEDSARLLVAVESSPLAQLEVKRKYPGLEVIDASISDVLSGLTQLRYPTHDRFRAARSTIVNLDFNSSLDVQSTNGSLDLKLLQLLKKLAQIHTEPAPARWFLLLTLNSTITWEPAASAMVVSYLRANLGQSPDYASHLRNLMGDALFEDVVNGDPDFRSWSQLDQQKLLLAFVPKRIAFETHHQGWIVRTRHSVRYGGEAATAPMTSWILEFVPDSRASIVRNDLYEESISICIKTTQSIDADGNMVVFQHA
jgi:hypothetical protein